MSKEVFSLDESRVLQTKISGVFGRIGEISFCKREEDLVVELAFMIRVYMSDGD
jgi:hypothetical protein